MIELSSGHYYKKQLGCKSRIIAWSHRSRFEMALRLVEGRPRKLLDYGCGDGTFLAMIAARVEEGTGADIAADQIEDCRSRFATLKNLKFCMIEQLAEPTLQGCYDIVMCMETLEHCPPPVVKMVLNDLARLVSNTGKVIISVPIETGATFLIKLVLRKCAAWRGLGDYRYYESYSFRDAFQMIFANERTQLDRAVYETPNGPNHSHHGFNWRVLRGVIRTFLNIDDAFFSPLGFLGGAVSSQIWFVCSRKHDRC